MNLDAVSGCNGGSPALDSASCALEPVHIPGAIQPHGALLAALVDGLLVTHASDNLAAILGLPVEAVLGRPLAWVIGESACRALVRSGPSLENWEEPVHLLSQPDGSNLFLRAHLTGRHVCVDIEPIETEPLHRRPIFMARSVMATFARSRSDIELCELAVCGLKAIGGYDRVMAYRFAGDGHGEVIAEALEPHLDPYFGQHYPASDIPPQARRLYLRQRVGAIADSSYTAVPLRVDPALDDGAPLDLTHSALRSVSPIHCEYMRNMNTAASMTVGLAHGPELWGMLVCHHGIPRIAGPGLRAAAEMIGQVVSLLLGKLDEAQTRAKRRERASILPSVRDRLATPSPLSEALTMAEAELLQLVEASGVAVRVSGSLVCLGKTPPVAAVERALAVLQPLADGNPLALDDLGLRHPDLVDCAREGSGALLLPIGSTNDDLILWFRPELIHTVTWGGNPAKAMVTQSVAGHISPRTSFAAWKESVRGCSLPWTETDLELARELRSAVEADMARRTTVSLRESRAEVGLLVENSGDVVLFVGLDASRHYVSPAVERLLGWRPDEMVGPTAVLGNAPEAFVHPEDQRMFREARSALLTGDVSENSICFRYLRRDGTWQWVDGRARMRMNASGTGAEGVVVTLSDATERKTFEFKLIDALERMAQMAATDGLTGLANRRHFDGVADTEWRRCARDNQSLSVLLLDADHFKLFNDRYGHPAGDDCLRAIASQLTVAARRPGDLVARYGGEEFLLLMPHTDRVGALHVAERVRRLVEDRSIAHEDNSAHGVVTVSIGAATTQPGNAESRLPSVEALVAAADAALYEAKLGGRNRVVFAGEELP